MVTTFDLCHQPKLLWGIAPTLCRVPPTYWIFPSHLKRMMASCFSCVVPSKTHPWASIWVLMVDLLGHLTLICTISPME